MSLTQAAKHYSVSKGVLSKSLSSGKLSYVSKTDTGYEIDPAEMDRFIKFYKRKGDVSKDGVSKTKEPPNHNPKESDSLTILLQKNESLYEEQIEASKKFHELEISLLKERLQEVKEELARTNQRLLDQPKQWQEEQEKKEQELNKKLKEEQEKKDRELNKILQEEREKKEQELNKILELQQTKQQEQKKAEQKRQLVFFLILLILSAGLFLGLN